MPKMDERIRDLATDIATVVKGKAASIHTHAASQITDFANAADARIAAATTLVRKVSTGVPQMVSGWWMKLSLTAYSTGAEAEVLMVEGYRTGAARRAFWLNENGSPRGASVNSEPAMKLFGPDADAAYAGLLFQIQKRYGDQEHRFGVHSDGRFRMGTGQTPAMAAVVLGASDPVPSGLPAQTPIIRLP